jgi:Glycosyl hydrolase family 71
MNTYGKFCALVVLIIAVSGDEGFEAKGASINSLPFDMPASSTLSASSHKVFAHYFPVFPISMDNKPSGEDSYTTQFLNPEGQGGKYAATGGFIRERPLPRAVNLSTNWQLDDMETEVRRASGAGLDGFAFDILSVSGVYWNRLKLLLEAAAIVDPNFRIMLRPASDASDVSDPQALASAIAGIANDPGVFHLSDGSLVVSPFAPESQGAPWWANWIDIMQDQYGIKIALVPCFVRYSASNTSAFAPLSYGLSSWGNRSPDPDQSAGAITIDDAHALGKIWMQPVSAQDERPNSGVYWEADNTENYRCTWNAAINDGADWVMIPTWNDYSEGTEISPSTHIGWGFLDLASYYLTRFKTGQWPTIVRDVIYVSHRVQFANALPQASGGEKKLMKLVSRSPARDAVEVLSFLTAPSIVEVNIGDKTQEVSVPAGESAVLLELAPGAISAQVIRNGQSIISVNSPFFVQTNFPIQNEQYYMVTNGREVLATRR